MKRLFLLWAGLMLGSFAFAQNPFNPVTASRLVMGTSLPSTCSVGQVFFKSNASAGGNVYGCTAANTWTPQTGGGVAGVSAFNSRTGAVTLALSDVQGVTGDKGTYVFGAGYNGAACDNSTDDTTAFTTLLSTVNTAGGGGILIAGGCLIAGTVVFPNDGASVPHQSTIEIYGYGNTTNGVWGAIPAAAIPTAKSYLNLTNNASVAKLDTRGIGQLIIHDLNLIDSSTDCAAFIQTTNTGLTVYNVTFSGTAVSQSACNDALVFGGTTTANNGTSTSSFQGYHTNIYSNYFDRIRRAGNFQVFANGIKFYDNTISASSGSNLTTAISACTNATPTVCTSTAHGLGTPVVNQTATSYPMTITGATGNWTPLNGAQQATPIDANTFSIALNATAFGALAGSPAYYSGSVLDFNGNNGTSTIFGAEVTGNLVETKFYGRFVNSTFGTRLSLKGNNLYDSALGVTSVYYWFGPSAIQNLVIPGHQDVASSVPTVNISTAATVLDGSNSGYNVQGNAFFPQMNVVLGPLGTNAVNVTSPSTNSSGVQFKFSSNVGLSTKTGLFQMDNTGNLIFRASNNPIFLDYTTSLNMRAGAGGGGTQFSLTSTGLTLSPYAGTGSRPLCVTSTGLIEVGSLSAGLVTCP